MEFKAMLYKTFFLCLVATAVAMPATKDLDSVFSDIFGSKTPATKNANSTSPAQQKGKCVPYYKCKSVGIPSLITNVSTATYEYPCTSYLDVWCIEEEVPQKKTGCGWRNPEGLGNNIKDDNLAEFGEFPWMCAINKLERMTDAKSDTRMINIYGGGGSLIHPSVVLTAAHVVSTPGAILRVRAGEWDTQSNKEPYPFQDRDVLSMVLHEEFNKGNFYNDVALLFLTEPMDITAPNVGLACLPPHHVKVDEKTRCFATGWGKNKFKGGNYQFTLKKVEVPVVDSSTCTTQLRKTQLTDIFELHSTFMCAGGEPSKDTCTGDGGSPLVCPIEDEEDRFVQAGIVSWGVGCGENGIPGVYTKVSSLRQWIDDKVEEQGYDTLVYLAEF